MLRSLNVKFDGKYVLQIQVSGTDELVKKLTDDTWFNSNVRDGIKKLVDHTIEKKLKENE